MDELKMTSKYRQLKRIQDVINSENLSQVKGYVLLCRGVRSGNKEIVDLLLQKGVIVNGQSDDKIYKKLIPLNIAIENGDVKVVRMLLDREASVNYTDDLNRTPLYFAYRKSIDDAWGRSKMDEIIKLLIDKGATLENSYTQNNIEEAYDYLKLAISRGDLSVVEHILKCGADVNAILDFDNDYTPLHTACENKDNNCVLMLLGHGADVNAKAKGNVTPLHVAVERGGLNDCVKTLLDHGSNIDAEDENGDTVLNIATKKENCWIVNCLLKYNPSLNSKGNMRSLCTALSEYRQYNRDIRLNTIIASLSKYGFTLTPEIVDHYELLNGAMAAGFPSIVTDFLNSVTDFDPVFQHRDEDGHTLLDNACKYNAICTFKYLLDKGADINIRTTHGRSLLHVAVGYDQMEIIEEVLSRGVSVDDHDGKGKTILHMAAKSCTLDSIKVILKYGPDINNSSNRKSVRMAVISKRSKEIIQTLFDYGFGVEPDSERDYTFLECAIQLQHFNILEEILKQSSADIMAKFEQNKGYTTLHVAAECKHPEKEIVELLLKYGVNINAVDEWLGQTPLILLIRNVVDRVKSEFTEEPGEEISTNVKQSLELVEILLRCNANPNSRDNKGNTALHYAASSRLAMEETVILLLNYGAIVNPRNRIGKTPLMIATKKGNRSVEKVLLRHGGLTAFGFKHVADIAFLSSNASKLDLRRYFEIPLKLGADINSVDYEFAKRYYGKRDLIPYLLDYGLDIKPFVTSSLYASVHNLHIAEYGARMKFAGFKGFDICMVAGARVWCPAELKRMENKKIHDTFVSLRDILTDDTTRLAAYAKNEHIVRYIESEDCKTNFPIYAPILNGFLWRGIVKRHLLAGGIKLFRYYCSSLPELPDLCIEHILGCMGDENLRSFVRSHLNMFSIEEGRDVKWSEEKDLLLDGVIQPDNGKASSIYLEEDNYDPDVYLHYCAQDEDDYSSYSEDEDNNFHSSDEDSY